jgi:hypothetical protein
VLSAFTPVAVAVAISIGVDLAVGSIPVAKIAMRHVKLLPGS